MFDCFVCFSCTVVAFFVAWRVDPRAYVAAVAVGVGAAMAALAAVLVNTTRFQAHCFKYGYYYDA